MQQGCGSVEQVSVRRSATATIDIGQASVEQTATAMSQDMLLSSGQL
ncbi:MAG: hypothetical protein ACI350_04920 [Prevotella sp.]